MIQIAINVPVRPSPAKQCTATTPLLSLTTLRNLRTISAGGEVQSSNCRSWWRNPFSTKADLSYFSRSLSLGFRI